MVLENSNRIDPIKTLKNDQSILKTDIIIDDDSTLNNSTSIYVNDILYFDNSFENNDSTPIVIDSGTEDKNQNKKTKMNDELNKIVIVNLSNDDDSTSIPTPTITTVKAVGTDLKSVDDNYSQKLEENILSPTSSIDINVNNSINEVSTETITNTLKNSTERVLMAEPFEDISYENNNDNENDTLTNNDSSLSDIDLDQMISEQLNTDFTEVDLNS